MDGVYEISIYAIILVNGLQQVIHGVCKQLFLMK